MIRRMRAPTRAAIAALLGLLVAALLTAPASHAATSPKSKPCPKGTIVVGSAKSPVACVPTKPVGTAQQLLGVLSAAGKQAKPKARPRGKGPSKRAAKLLREVVAFAQARDAAGLPVFEAAKAQRAQASSGPSISNAPASFGTQTSAITDSSGMVTGGRFQSGEISLSMNAETDGVKMEVTDKSGAGGFMKFVPDAAPTPRCPTPAGDVPSKFDTKMTIGEYTIDGGHRYVASSTVIFDDPWHGYVGTSAKAEKFDVNASGRLEIRIHVEDRKTGKVVLRDGTRTYRAILDRKGLPIEATGASIVGGARFLGPKGAIKSSLDRQVASALGQLVVTHVDLVPSALKHGDTRWYDNRMCARVGLNQYRPSEVVRGDTGTWQIDVTDERGAPAADAEWTITSTCGTPAATKLRGQKVDLSVPDTSRNWGPDPYAPACVTADVTSTAGRAATFTHAIPPKKPDGRRFTIKVKYNENMGSGIAETNASLTGTVFLAWNAEEAEGTGTYSGDEWDGTVANPCGHDMARSRGFGGKATVGAVRNRDGSISVAIVAVDRPLRLSFLQVLEPGEDGTIRDSTGTQPFCGEAKRAKTTTKVTITSEAVPAE